MKTCHNSFFLLKLARCVTLLALGVSCIALGWKRKDRLNRLILDASQRMNGPLIFAEQELHARNLVALIPGTSIRGTLLRQRIETGARLFHSGVVSHLILSGDGRSPDYHEPHAMRRMLKELGVPERCMTEDPAGLSTYDSIQRAGRMAAGRRMVIVTQQLYCGRSLLLARGIGVDAIACAIPSQPTPAGLQREELACVRALIDLAGLRQWTEALEQRREVHLTRGLRAGVQG